MGAAYVVGEIVWRFATLLGVGDAVLLRLLLVLDRMLPTGRILNISSSAFWGPSNKINTIVRFDEQRNGIESKL